MSVKSEELRELLMSRFPNSGTALMPDYDLVSSGIGTLDELIAGGLRPGTLSLVSGGMSSGKTSVALSFASRLSRAQQCVAWLHAGTFSAPSAAHGGLDLRFLLQVNVRSARQSLRCLDLVLRETVFPLVVMDWSWSFVRDNAWQRIRTLLRGSKSALLVLSSPLPEGSPLRFLAAMHLHVSRPWNETLETERVDVFLQKSRYSAPGAGVQLDYGNASGPFALCAELPGLGQAWNADG